MSPLSQPTAAAAAAHIASASARPLAPVPALALPELTTTPAAIPDEARSRSMQASTGGARNLLVVKTAAVGHGLAVVGREQRGVAQARLDPGGKAGGDEASAAVTLMDNPMLERPAPSSRPSMRLAHWIICPAAPLPRLSIAASATTIPVRSS